MARANSTVANSQTPPGTPERRRALRKRVLWSGQVEAAEAPIRCAVIDVSLQGLRVRLDEGMLPQGPLALAVSRLGTFQAEVVWVQEKMAGLRFLESVEHVADTIGRQLPLAA
jgi:PilZ domain